MALVVIGTLERCDVHKHVDDLFDFGAGQLQTLVFGVQFLNDHLIEFAIFTLLVGLRFVDDLFDVVPDGCLDILNRDDDYADVSSNGLVEEGMEFVPLGEGQQAFLNLIFLVLKSLPSFVYSGDYVG